MRFHNLPERLRTCAELLANPPVVTDGQFIAIQAVMIDAALKIEALEHVVAKPEPTS